MATEYTVNGNATCLAPFSLRWRQQQTGRSHDQRALYSGNWEVDLSFGAASILWGQQWLDAASSGSANITILDKYKISFTDLSAVQLEVVAWPAIENINFGPWEMVVRGASPNN